ncbi:phage tail protein, partial [Paenibacillus alvei]|nr:phage tail protein [Paenibacillus alvei]
AATESAVKAAYDRANEAFQSGVDAKNRIAGAVNAKGVPASAADEWGTLEWKIGQITTGVPIARIRTNVSEYPKNFLISEGGTVNWALYFIMVTGLSFTAKGIVVLNSAFRVIAAYDFYSNQAISVDGAHYNHQILYRDTLPQLNEYSIFATITPTSFIAPVSYYDDDRGVPASVIVYG